MGDEDMNQAQKRMRANDLALPTGMANPAGRAFSGCHSAFREGDEGDAGSRGRCCIIVVALATPDCYVNLRAWPMLCNSRLKFLNGRRCTDIFV